MIWPLRLRGSMQLTFKSISRYVVALVLVFATLLYTGIIRRTFYALPIAATKVFSAANTTMKVKSQMFKLRRCVKHQTETMAATSQMM